MPTLAVTLTSLLTPAHTFRSTHSVTADVKSEYSEAIPVTALLPADQTANDQIAVLVDCGLPGIPNAAASNDVVGICAGGEAPMRFWFLGDPQTSGTLVQGTTYVITAYKGADDFSTSHEADSPDRAQTTPAGYTGMIFTCDDTTTPAVWASSTEVRPVLATIDCGGGPNDTVTDGPGDIIWPTYANQADPTVRNAGDITMVAVTREKAGASGNDNQTNFNQDMDMRLAIYYDVN